MKKKGIPEVLVRILVRLHKGAKIRFRVESETSEEFEVRV